MARSHYTIERFWASMTSDDPAFEFVENMPWASHWHEECKKHDGWEPYVGQHLKHPGRFTATPTRKTFPSISAYFEGKPNYLNPEIMKLEPGAVIPPHLHDEDYLYNMAINHPEGCKFGFIRGGLVPYKAGDVYKLNVKADHCVFNDSTEDRYHLVWKERNAD